jgi:hypothetical protein
VRRRPGPAAAAHRQSVSNDLWVRHGPVGRAGYACTVQKGTSHDDHGDRAGVRH